MICFHGRTWQVISTQQNSYSISHMHGTVTTRWLDSENVVTNGNCRQLGDCEVAVLPAVNNIDCIVTIRHCVVTCAVLVNDGIGVLLCSCTAQWLALHVTRMLFNLVQNKIISISSHKLNSYSSYKVPFCYGTVNHVHIVTLLYLWNHTFFQYLFTAPLLLLLKE